MKIISGVWSLYFIIAGLVLAQGPTAEVVGTLRDPSGAVVPGAAVRIRNVDTNGVRDAVSTEGGQYTITNLNPGRYELVVEKEGFTSRRETGVVLQVSQTARLDLVLKVGSVAETVEVKAEVPLLNTENGVRGDVIVNQEIVEMPLDGRSVEDLALLVPGVSESAEGSIGSGYNIAGTRGDNANFVMDGFNNRRPEYGQMQVSPNLDAMQEFKMETANYSAQYGRLAGGVMNMALKSGSNKVHATLFEFLRNDRFDARNFFDQEKHKLRRNQFGGVVSGPVVVPKLYQGRDRTFFMFSWESYREVVGNTALSRVPTPEEQAGDFSLTRAANGKPLTLRDPLGAGAFPGNRVPANRISAIAAKVAAFYPTPNRPDQANNYVTQQPSPNTWDSFLAKVDHRLGPKDDLSFRITRRRNAFSKPFDSGNLGIFGSKTDTPLWLAGLTETRMFTPAFINEFRLGFTRVSTWQQNWDAGHNYAAEFGLPVNTTDPALLGFPLFTVRDLPNLGDNTNRPYKNASTIYQLSDTVTWVKGRHQVKFGGEILRSLQCQPFFNNVRGTYNFLGNWTTAPFADFLLGMPDSVSRQARNPENYISSSDYGLFVQDDFKVSSRLTLNLGLRYELPVPMVDKYGRMSNFVPEYQKIIIADDRGLPDLNALVAGVGLTNAVGLAKDYGLPSSLAKMRYNRVAPRWGFAWRPFSSNRTVLRGGYGIYFGASGQSFVTKQVANFFPFGITQTVNRQTNNPLGLTLDMANPFGTAKYGGVSFNGFQVDAPAQYVQSYNLTVEQQLSGSTVLGVSYAGSKGTHLGRIYDINQPYFDPALRLPNGNFPRPYSAAAPNNPINYFAFGSNSFYSAGTVTLRRQFASGFFYRFNYTYSKSIDDASQINGAGRGGFAGAQDSRNLGLERGRSDFDRGHTFSMNYSYQIPWRGSAGWGRLLKGWQLAGTGRASTGAAFTVVTSNVNKNLTPASRPDRLAKGTLSTPSPERWFDLGAFSVVPTGEYRVGNSARNILDGPGALSMNLSLIRNMRMGELGTLQFRWETFNTFNHANFGLPINSVNAVNSGTIVSAGAGRSMQFGLRLQM